MSLHNLSFATKEEYAFRLAIFEQVDAELEEINANPEYTFTVAHNQFSTLTKDEMKKYKGYKPDDSELAGEPTYLPETNLGAADWRSKLQPIQNQGSCGSCWAFATIQEIEGHHNIKTGQSIKLSEQQLVDCVYSRSGCDGGSPQSAQNWISTHGSATRTAYPYTGRYAGGCRSSAGNIKITTKHNVAGSDLTQMKAAVSKGPVAVCLGTDRAFDNYSSGIFNEAGCPT